MALRRALSGAVTEVICQRFGALEPVTSSICSTSSHDYDPPQLFFHRTHTTQRKTRRSLNNQANWLAAHKHLQRKGDDGSLRRQQAEVLKTAVPDLPALDYPDPYQKVGFVTRSYRLLKEKAFAVVEVGGSQFKVTRDDVIFPNKMHGLDINDVVALDRVLLVGTPDLSVFGRPFIPGASVLAAVESQFKDAKIHVFKKKPGVNYQRSKGHRQQMTALRILDIVGVDQLEKQPAVLPIKFTTKQFSHLPSSHLTPQQHKEATPDAEPGSVSP